MEGLSKRVEKFRLYSTDICDNLLVTKRDALDKAGDLALHSGGVAIWNM